MIFSLDLLNYELSINLLKMIRAKSIARRTYFEVANATRLVSGIQNYGFIVIVGEKYATLVHRF
jgi:hypothetical protein